MARSKEPSLLAARMSKHASTDLTTRFVTFGYQFMLTLFVQTMGMGLAGYLRRFSVYPVKALWPTILPTIAMNRALTRQEPRETIRAFGKNWTASR